MFVTKKFIYLQLQKTACTHIASLMDRNVEGDQVGKHGRPKETEDKFIVGSIRNPWDWYVSLWAFGCQNNGGLHSRLVNRNMTQAIHYLLPMSKNSLNKKKFQKKYNQSDLFRYLIGEATKPVGLWKKLYQDPFEKNSFKSWLFKIHDPKRKWDHGVQYAANPLSKFAGLLTFRYARLFWKDVKFSQFRGIENMEKLKSFDEDNNYLDFMIKTESLSNDLLELFRKTNYVLSESQKESFYQDANKKSNTSNHKAFPYYHDRETIEFIGERDSLIINKYGYQPPTLDG